MAVVICGRCNRVATTKNRRIVYRDGVASCWPDCQDSFKAAVDRVAIYLDVFEQMGGPYSKDTINIIGANGERYPLHVADLRIMVDAAMGTRDNTGVPPPRWEPITN